jgi:outer membrane protein TolC
MTRVFVITAVLLATAAPATADTKLTLADVVARSLANPLARAAGHATEAASAQAAEARGARFPRLQVTSFLAPSPEITCEDPTCTTTSPTDVTINVAGVFGGVRAELTQPLYTFGKLSAISAAAQHAAQATRFLEDATAGDLVFNASRAYYGLKLARELVWMLEDGVAEITKGQTTLEERLAEGSPEVTIQDRMRLETLLAEVEARLSEAREAEAAALAGIRALVGDPGADIDAESLEAVAYALAPGNQVYVDRAQVGRAELRAARQAIKSVDGLLDFEKARYYPDLVLLGGVNFARAGGVDNPPSAFANDPFNTLGASLGLVLRWTIDPVSQHARVDRLRAETRRVTALSEAASLGVTMEAQRAHAKAAQAQARLQASAKGERAARGWVASVVQADAIGAASAKDLADAYVAYFTLRGRVLQSTYDWNLATVELRRASGEFVATTARP